VSGGHDDRATEVKLSDESDQIDASSIRLAVVHQSHPSQLLVVRNAERQSRRLRNLIVLPLEASRDIAGQEWLILDDQDGVVHCRAIAS
jgi:hypothetical protein